MVPELSLATAVPDHELSLATAVPQHHSLMMPTSNQSAYRKLAFVTTCIATLLKVLIVSREDGARRSLDKTGKHVYQNSWKKSTLANEPWRTLHP